MNEENESEAFNQMIFSCVTLAAIIGMGPPRKTGFERRKQVNKEGADEDSRPNAIPKATGNIREVVGANDLGLISLVLRGSRSHCRTVSCRLGSMISLYAVRFWSCDAPSTG